MDKKVFLDLEETIIKEIDDPVVVNESLIKKIIKENDIKEVNIFSFAIFSDTERQKFIKQLKTPIEQIFDISINTIFTLEEIKFLCLKETGVVFTDFEFSSIWGKFKSFHDFVIGLTKLNKITNTEFILIDDTVMNTRLTLEDTGIVIRTVNVPKGKF